MKNCMLLFLVLLSLNSFSQEKKLSYYFDYYTVYDYKETEKKNAKTSVELSFSNSKDSTYVLSLILKNEQVKYATLFDYKISVAHIYKYEGVLKNYDDVRLFNSASTVPYNQNCSDGTSKFIYEVHYTTHDKNTISINTYKNNKRKTFVSETVLETKPSPIVQNQHYNLSILFAPLWCNKFSLSNKNVIETSYFLIQGTKKHLRNLVEISKTNFTITIDPTNNTQQ